SGGANVRGQEVEDHGQMAELAIVLYERALQVPNASSGGSSESVFQRLAALYQVSRDGARSGTEPYRATSAIFLRAAQEVVGRRESQFAARRMARFSYHLCLPGGSPAGATGRRDGQALPTSLTFPE